MYILKSWVWKTEGNTEKLLEVSDYHFCDNRIRFNLEQFIFCTSMLSNKN